MRGGANLADEELKGLMDAVTEAIRKMDYNTLQKLNAFIAGLKAQLNGPIEGQGGG